MVKIGNKMPSICLNKIRPLARVRSRASIDDLEKKDGFSGGVKVDSGRGGKKSGPLSCRKIMIVVDSSIHAKNAVQWALTHTVHNQDLVILLHVTKPCKKADEQSIKRDATNSRIPEFVTRIKSLCQLKRPEVCVEVVMVEGKEKGPAIVEAAKREEVAQLVVGQKKRSVTWRLMVTWAGNRAVGVAEYCVQNASCVAIAVRRKSKKVGGYLITTKRHKDFWLLA